MGEHAARSELCRQGVSCRCRPSPAYAEHCITLRAWPACLCAESQGLRWDESGTLNGGSSLQRSRVGQHGDNFSPHSLLTGLEVRVSAELRRGICILQHAKKTEPLSETDA